MSDWAGPGAAEYGLLSPVWAGAPAAVATGDDALVRALLRVESAWVRVQAGAGLASPAEASAAANASEEAARLLGDGGVEQLAARVPAGGNALIPLLKDYRARVGELHGAPVAAVHRGATSQDILDTALLLLARDAALGLADDLDAAADALTALSLEHRDDLAIARSLSQHALPITVGHRLARWAAGLDDAAGFVRSVAGALPVQWGGAAGTLASLVDALEARGSATPEEEARDLVRSLAEELGLLAPVTAWHTRRTPFLRLASALAEVVANAGKIASDVLLLARPEIAELAEPQAPGKGGSSAMPHKRNPVLAVMIKEAALQAPAQLSTLFLAAGQAVDERPDGAWHAEWEALRSLLRLAGGSAHRLRELAQGLQLFPDRSAEVAALFGDVVLSERLAARLVKALPGGAARLDELVAASLDGGEPLGAALRAELDPGAVSDAQLAGLLDPRTYLGLAPSDVDALARSHRARRGLETN